MIAASGLVCAQVIGAKNVALLLCNKGLVLTYGAVIGFPIITFMIGDYWGRPIPAGSLHPQDCGDDFSYGRCWDNAPMESFFHPLKTGLRAATASQPQGGR